MSTLNQIIYNVRNPVSGGKGHRDQGTTNRQIAKWVQVGRNFLMYADAGKKGYVCPGWDQDLGCVTLEKCDQADCSKFKWGEVVKKVTIPRVLDLPRNGGITFFGLIDKRTRIYLPDQSYGALDDHMQYKKEKWYEAQLIGNTIYVGPSLTDNEARNEESRERVRKLCTVNIRVVADDPTLVQTCASEGVEATCFDWDTDCYPLPAHLEGALYTYIDQNFVNKASAPEDIETDEKKESLL